MEGQQADSDDDSEEDDESEEVNSKIIQISQKFKNLNSQISIAISGRL